MRIGELAAATGTTTKTLRFYEAAGLLQAAPRAGNGYRDYPVDIIDRLDFIRRGQAAGLTLAQVRDILDIRDAGQPPCQHVQNLLADRLAHLDRQIADLLGLRETVAQLQHDAALAEPDTCQASQVCRYL